MWIGYDNKMINLDYINSIQIRREQNNKQEEVYHLVAWDAKGDINLTYSYNEDYIYKISSEIVQAMKDNLNFYYIEPEE